MASNVSIYASFIAGLLSFLSPCVLPLIPVYLSFISGESVSDIREGKARLQIFLRSLFFVLGFTVIFVLFSILFSGFASILSVKVLDYITTGAGVIIIILGFNIIFDFIPFLRATYKAEATIKEVSLVKSFLFGMLFATGWTPCVGPILGTILTVATTSGNVFYGVILLIAYSLGLGIPFLLTGLFFDFVEPILKWFKRHMKAVKIISGILIILFGVLMLTSGLDSINRFFSSLGVALQEYSQTGITPFKEIAGFLARWFLFQGI